MAKKNRTKNKRKIPGQIHCLLLAEFGKEKQNKNQKKIIAPIYYFCKIAQFGKEKQNK